MKSTWSVDNFYIGKMPASPSMMSDDFDSQTMSDSWLFINEGKVKNYCEHNIRWGVVPGYTKSRMFCFLCCWDKPFASAQQRAFKSCFWTTPHYSNPISYNTPSHYITLQSTQYFTKRNFRHRSIAITHKMVTASWQVVWQRNIWLYIDYIFGHHDIPKSKIFIILCVLFSDTCSFVVFIKIKLLKTTL